MILNFGQALTKTLLEWILRWGTGFLRAQPPPPPPVCGAQKSLVNQAFFVLKKPRGGGDYGAPTRKSSRFVGPEPSGTCNRLYTSQKRVTGVAFTHSSCPRARTFFLFTRSRLQSHEGEFWSMLVVGLPALSRPVVSASLHRQCTKRNIVPVQPCVAEEHSGRMKDSLSLER